MKNKYLVLVGLLFFTISATNHTFAQETYPCSILTVGYGIDSSLVLDDTRLESWLQEQSDTSYTNLSLQCSLLNTKVQNMLNSLQNNYVIKNDTLWLDSTYCIVDHVFFIGKLEALGKTLQHRSTTYDQMERDRQLEMLRAEEEAARATLLAQQQARNDSAAMIKKTIEEYHNQIGDLCDGVGVSDKKQVKRLKDLYYNYLSIYNKYDLSLVEPTSAQLLTVEELASLQKNILDSVLSPSSYHARIAQFPTTLKQRSSSGHKEVFKSYQSCMRERETEVPIHFSTPAEYYQFVQRLKDIISVQQLYLLTVAEREKIAGNSVTVLKHASHRSDVQDTYKEALALIDQKPAFTTIKGGLDFIQQLQQFAEVQGKYIDVVNQLDSIDNYGIRVLKQCKNYKDLTTGYKELCEVYDFAVSFSTLDGAAFFEKSLDDFKVLQNTYIQLLSLRQTITRQEKELLSNNFLPRDVKDGYIAITEATTFKPDFVNVPQSEVFVDNMNNFIRVQEQVLMIETKQHTIEFNLKELKTLSKENAPIVKAYHVLRDEAELKFEIRSLADLEAYIRYQERQLYLQEKFMEMIKGAERDEFNRRLKGVRSSEKIHAITNL